MRLTRRTRLAGVALLAAGGLTLAACGSSDTKSSSGGSDIISAYDTEPQNPLVPSSTNEVGGGHIIDQLWAGLVAYKSDGSTVNEVAKSITSDDDKVWTVKLNTGWKFSDGTPVTSKNFVDAWNYGALSTNKQLNSYFYYPIAGFDDVQKAKPTVKTLSGLKVVSDSEFTITLAQPENEFPLRLGYSAFYPLPETAFKDIKAFGENPVGNGPYKLSKKGAWDHKKQITLVKNDEYNGYRKPKNDGLTFVFYTDSDPAYTAVQSGSLDILDTLPTSAYSTFKTDSSVQAISEAGSNFSSFTIPVTLAHFGENKEGKLRRQAISYAIDRAQICDKIFSGTRTPAKDFTSPLMPGFDENVAGNEVLKFDPTKAKALWAEANKISPWSGKFQLGYNPEGGNKDWVDASMNQVKNTLGIDASGKAYPDFKSLRSDVTGRTIKTAFRTGWQPDYPSMFNYLQPLYQTKAGSNDGDYSSAAFDKLIGEAAGAKSDTDRYKLQNEAQAVLFQDLPAIPLWYQSIAGVAGKDVKGVSFNWQNVPDYYLAHKG